MIVENVIKRLWLSTGVFIVVQVVSENWVVYHYFNLRQHRYEMSVLEIYDHSRLV